MLIHAEEIGQFKNPNQESAYRKVTVLKGALEKLAHDLLSLDGGKPGQPGHLQLKQADVTNLCKREPANFEEALIEKAKASLTADIKFDRDSKKVTSMTVVSDGFYASYSTHQPGVFVKNSLSCYRYHQVSEDYREDLGVMFKSNGNLTVREHLGVYTGRDPERAL